MRRAVLITLAVSAIALLPGCLERRLHITSNPSGALVHLNDVEVGRTPVEVDFTYYGTYDVRLKKEGYEPLVTSAEAKAPLIEYPGFDLFGEIIPHRFVTDIRWNFDLRPQVKDPDALIERGRALRTQVGGDGSHPEAEQPASPEAPEDPGEAPAPAAPEEPKPNDN